MSTEFSLISALLNFTGITSDKNKLYFDLYFYHYLDSGCPECDLREWGFYGATKILKVTQFIDLGQSSSCKSLTKYHFI